MRVALVGEYPIDPDKIFGGPQSVFVYLLEGLKEIKDLDLHVVSCIKQIRRNVNMRKDGVSFSFLPHPHLPTELAYPLLKRRIHQSLREIQPDLIHSQQFLPIFGPICLSSGFPTVATAHNVPGNEPRFAPNILNRFRLELHEKILGFTFLPRIRHIISISEYIRKGLSDRTHATFYPVDNPVSRSFFDIAQPAHVLHKLLFVGFLRQRKRPDLAIKILSLVRKKIPDISLHMAGTPINNSYFLKLQRLIGQYHLQDSIHFLGQLDEHHLLLEYQDTGPLFLTSELETSPMSILQAMAAGKPVVSTSVGGIPYIIEDGKTGFLFEPGDVEGMASAIVRLLEDKELYFQISNNANKAARERFHCSSVARKMVDAYKRVLSQPD